MGGRDRWISEFEASLVYKVSYRTARATQRYPVSKNQKKKKKMSERWKTEIAKTLISLLLQPIPPHCRVFQ